MMRSWVALLGLSLVFSAAAAVSLDAEAAPKKKKKTEQKAKEAPKETPKQTPVVAAPPVEVTPAPSAADLEALKREEENLRVEAAKKKLELEARKTSKITPGTASRWSNKGAMTPIVSEVPITVELPERAIPLAPGQETPGQNLQGDEELLQFRLHISANHMETRGQDFIYYTTPPEEGMLTERVLGVDRDIDLYRGRASINYEHIAGSDFGLHLDLEYRPRRKGARFTDHRINELYASYGLTDFRRDDGMSFGISFGRVAVREAGFAQADGLLFRLKLTDELKLGAFGGFTGNPFGFNWAQRKTQEFSADWLRAGAFAAYREGRFVANLAGVATLNRLSGQPLPGSPGVVANKSLDRVYLYLDTSFLATETLNLFLTGWIDLIGSDLMQNVELVAAWNPIDVLNLRFGAGRFTTVVYDVSTFYSYQSDFSYNRVNSGNPVIVDENGAPIVPYDAVLASATYTTFDVRAGVSPIRELELFTSMDLMLRDPSTINNLTRVTVGNATPFETLRFLPSVGVRFRDPELLDASAQFTYILDKQSNADMMVRGAIGRGIFGLYGQVDARAYFGDIPGSDAGAELSYQVPREWTMGRLMFRLMFRYFRENVALLRPEVLVEVEGADPAAAKFEDFFRIPIQESFLGFASAEWRF